MKRNLLTGLVVLASGAALMASPAGATHNHYLRTPGGCHQVAAGSTARHHHYHEHVHDPVGKNGGPLDPNNAGPAPVSLSTTAC